ncbi:MAG TPA: TIGR00730 family Rossman fold protein [Thermoanaerobaculia bacterium]|nr:TIGR00730 family Rossman fold protein [Thermoanaerobaculia bacterium]
MERICVFCGSNRGAREEYAEAARSLAAALVSNDLTVVYGGGRVGLMGVVADEVLRLGGRAIGVIPRALWDREVGHPNLTEVRIVETMHERKATMADLSDGFIALPGGLGTLEEIFEVWTWAQLGMHAKPCGFLDVGGYYTPLMQFLDRAVDEAFVRPDVRNAAIVDTDPDRILARFRDYVPAAVQKWIHRDET